MHALREAHGGALLQPFVRLDCLPDRGLRLDLLRCWSHPDLGALQQGSGHRQDAVIAQAMSVDLGGMSFSDISSVGTLGLVVILILLGWLVPRKVVKDMRDDRDARLVEARSETANWQKAYQAVDQARELQAVQLGQLLELAKTTDQFIRTLQRAASSAREDTA